MTENIENLVLEHLRVIRGRVDKIDEGQGRLEHRLSTVEHHLAALVSGGPKEMKIKTASEVRAEIGLFYVKLALIFGTVYFAVKAAI
jgi:hypothetical protein